jgi:tRNA(fMet)-specific endonuclease VapC
MILLDTDHLSVLRGKPSERRTRLVARLAEVVDEPIGTTIVTVEEQLRGWLASIAKERQFHRQVNPYHELHRLVTFFSAYPIVDFGSEVADLTVTFGRIKIGTSDRKIAAIAITQNALLLTANRQDFELVPGLRFENWMD